MQRVDFLITNDGHHSAMFLPVIRRLRETEGIECRVVSLCELRGLRSPEATYESEGLPLVEVLPWQVRSSPSVGRKKSPEAAGKLRRMAQAGLWHLLLAPRLRRCFSRPTALVVLPNDGGFPYDRICGLLRARRMAFATLQEGIRFRQPRQTDQGQGGSDALLVWGESSADYYREQGAAPESLVVTGCPRFDTVARADWEAQAATLAGELGLGARNLLLLSNPIDDLGFGSHETKLELLHRFVQGLEPLLTDPEFRLVIKLHRRESAADLERTLGDLRHVERIRIVEDAPLYPLLAAVDAATVIATSAGLEALMLGVPLGVLEIPGFGFAHDYVSSGAALGLSWDAPLAPQVEALLSGPKGRAGTVERYLDRNLANRGGATDNVAGALLGLLRQAAPGRA